GEFFKWSHLATNLELDNNVFMAEQVSQDGADMMGVPSSLVACSNNVMVWLGDGPYPAALPPCFTVTKDRSVWDTAAATWLPRPGGRRCASTRARAPDSTRRVTARPSEYRRHLGAVQSGFPVSVMILGGTAPSTARPARVTLVAMFGPLVASATVALDVVAAL